MAITSVVLDIKTNTERALNDFKRFSSQLDNKFLVSGLKLDVVRSALGQINREFQKAIGEQGLTAGQSLRAAQNQASLLTQTFKSFSSTASAEMAQQFSSAFSQIAVTAGGTAQDIQKALAATPFISTNLSGDMRKALGDGLLQFQRDFRRAGVTDDFGGIAKQFLAGKLSAKQMMESGDAGQSFIGSQLMKSSGGNIDTITDAEERSKAVLKALSDPQFQKQLSEMAKSTSGFKSIIEDLNSTLFNPEAGIFGSLRKVAMSIKDKTTVFDETKKLIESVFGREGLFVNFFKQIGKIFGIEDPLKVIIVGIRFITKQFDALNRFIQSQAFQDIIKKIREVFNVIKDFFTQLYNQVTSDFSDPTSLIGQVKQIGADIGGFFEQLYTTISTGAWEPASAVADIKKVGQAARKFIEQIGKSFRDMDVEKQGSLFLEIFKTMVAEVAQTLGTAIKEAILSVFSGKGLAVVGGVLTVLYEGLSKFFAGLFGGNQGAGAALGGAAMAALGVLFVRRIRGALESILRPIQALRTGGGGVGGFANRFFGGGRGGGDLDPNALGSTQTFQTRVVFYLQRIAACVCGPGGIGGGGGSDVDPDGPNRRRTGRSNVSSLGYAGRNRPGSPVELPDVRRSYLASGRESARNILGRGSSSAALEAYTESLRGPYSEMDADQRGLIASKNAEESGQRTADRYNRRYSKRARIGRFGNRIGRFSSGIMDTIAGNNDLLPEADDIDDNLSEKDRAQKAYNKKYSKDMSRRSRMGRGVRGFGRGIKGFGKGALIAGGLTLGAAALFGGGDAQAGTVDPQTGEPIETPRQRQMAGVGNVLSGGFEGAMIGATIGSIVPGIGTAAGAVIGGVIGGVVPLLDKGTRDGVGTFVSGIGNSLQKAGKNILDSAGRGVNFIKEGFEGIGKWFSQIDWKSVLIAALVPGGNMTIQGLQGISAFASKLSIFDGIKAGIDAISSTATSILSGDWLPKALGGKREAGGTVIKGSSYIVGESGPEIFTPGATGSISTNRDLMAMRLGSGSASSVSANFNIAINVNGAMGSGEVEALRGPVLRIVEEAWASATQGTISRGVVG